MFIDKHKHLTWHEHIKTFSAANTVIIRKEITHVTVHRRVIKNQLHV